MKVTIIEPLLGKIIEKVTHNKNEFILHDYHGYQYKFYHEQDCCEYVELLDVCGDTKDLLDSSIVMAEEVIDHNEPPREVDGVFHNTHTWTFYKIGTLRGTVTLRWYGSSNGFYSEKVSFIIIDTAKRKRKRVKEKFGWIIEDELFLDWLLEEPEKGE